ncbi:MAG: hypothetical protein NW237_11760 [Cyanobacteriota bacterium]|nr:hypothetical protein [Cyanobacteriota bacterium]
MLKLIYTETGIYLEIVAESLQDWLAIRQSLSACLDQPFVIESSAASFLLPADLPGLETLAEQIDLDICDTDYLEVSLEGMWISSNAQGSEGVFVCDALDHLVEAQLLQLWQLSEGSTAMMTHSPDN